MAGHAPRAPPTGLRYAKMASMAVCPACPRGAGRGSTSAAWTRGRSARSSPGPHHRPPGSQEGASWSSARNRLQQHRSTPDIPSGRASHVRHERHFSVRTSPVTPTLRIATPAGRKTSATGSGMATHPTRPAPALTGGRTRVPPRPSHRPAQAGAPRRRSSGCPDSGGPGQDRSGPW